jgi:hypothetical protein
MGDTALLSHRPRARGQSLLRVFELRQHFESVLRPTRQQNLVVGGELEAVITNDYHVGAHAKEAADRQNGAGTRQSAT